jgi:prepilin signal peptidase PulO-like enzyme (type II secretory pathway)
MAAPKISVSKNFVTQILFGFFLTLVFYVTWRDLPLSIFLGVLGGLALGWMTAASKTGPKQEVVDSSEGIDAGLRYWLFFLLGFVLVGYQTPISILLGALAGIGGGWIIAWWGSKEESRTQISSDTSQASEEESLTAGTTTRRRVRKTTRRYRRSPGSFDFRFWQK